MQIDAISKLNNLKFVDLSDIYSGIETEEAQGVLTDINNALSSKSIIELDYSDNALGPLGIKSCKSVLEVLLIIIKIEYGNFREITFM